MCQDHGASGQIRIVRCDHGTYHLTINDTTLHLSAVEVVALSKLLRQSIAQMADQVADDLRSERRWTDRWGWHAPN
jgi:hypothetical protein